MKAKISYGPRRTPGSSALTDVRADYSDYERKSFAAAPGLILPL